MPSYTAAFQNAPELREPVNLKVCGNIPSWLSGVLYRTGPGTYNIPTSKDPAQVVHVQHWFDGLSMNHRFEIHPDGHVSYCSRKSTDDYERQVADEGKLPGITFGQEHDICQSIFRKFFTTFKQRVSLPPSSPSSDNVGVTLTPNMPGWDKLISGLSSDALTREHAGPRYLVAKTDANLLQLLDPVSLEPLSTVTYQALDPRLDGQFSAAHECRDSEANEYYNYSLTLGPKPTYKIFKIKGDSGDIEILTEIKDAPPSYIHSFAITSKYVVLIIWQAHISGYGLPILYHKNVAQAIAKWNPDLDSVFYVIDKKKGGVVAKYTTPPFFCFHQLNAFDDPTKDDIVIDMAIYENHSVISNLYLDKLCNIKSENSMAMGRARRFRLSSITSPKSQRPRAAEVEFTLGQSDSIELPTINPGNSQRPYRYAYGINKRDAHDHSTFADRIIKLDVTNTESGHKFWQAPGYTPSEPIFVPRPDGQSEDDGAVLSVVLDGERGKSMLVILDATDMKEVARAEMETVYPIGFHGVFTPALKL
ncbi:carotenoid oxygenase [Marasmius fiardii PR-910]|nr:carotenoid oxygenase [Marasmius fiardii PR-910]